MNDASDIPGIAEPLFAGLQKFNCSRERRRLKKGIKHRKTGDVKKRANAVVRF
jgi:hypothetical protein